MLIKILPVLLVIILLLLSFHHLHMFVVNMDTDLYDIDGVLLFAHAALSLAVFNRRLPICVLKSRNTVLCLHVG